MYPEEQPTLRFNFVLFCFVSFCFVDFVFCFLFYFISFYFIRWFLVQQRTQYMLKFINYLRRWRQRKSSVLCANCLQLHRNSAHKHTQKFDMDLPVCKKFTNAHTHTHTYEKKIETQFTWS